MAEELPGFIPRVLQRGDVSLLRADEAVLEAMVDGWRAQMLARGLATSTITARCGLIGRFVEFTNEYPWRWRPLDLDQFLADLRSRETPIELSTLRSYSNAISMFCSYVSDSRYGWVPFCEKQFGDVPSQICFEWNTARHTTDDAVPTRRRAFTKTELQHFFDVVDDFVDEQHQAGSKRWLTALRDSIAFKIGYAYGLRRRELVMLDLTDFGPNPHVPRFGDYGAMTWHPASTGLDRWSEVYHRVTAANGAQADAGRRLLSWAIDAGFERVTPSAAVWCFATPEDREWWAGTWSERVVHSGFAEQAERYGLATRRDLESMRVAWREWGGAPDAWFAVVHGEVLATA